MWVIPGRRREMMVLSPMPVNLAEKQILQGKPNINQKGKDGKQGRKRKSP